MANAYEVVMESRKQLVDKMIRLMEQGVVFTKPLWEQGAILPYNPFTNVRYRGGNRFRLLDAVTENGYQDPRWGTFLQYQKKGYSIRKGEKGILCEKWIFEKEIREKNPEGKMELKKVPLERPMVSYFVVFNGEQVKDFPSYRPRELPPTELQDLTERLKSVSECPVVECAQTRAYYSLTEDRITLPLPGMFKDDASYLKTLLHEMGHSTGHPDRLNRDLGQPFGSEAYAREELRAEIGSLFLGQELGVKLDAEHYQDHSNYLSSWLSVLKKDYQEFFRACADAEKIADRITEQYEREYFPRNLIPEEEIPEHPRQRKKLVKVPGR